MYYFILCCNALCFFILLMMYLFSPQTYLKWYISAFCSQGRGYSFPWCLCTCFSRFWSWCWGNGWCHILSISPTTSSSKLLSCSDFCFSISPTTERYCNVMTHCLFPYYPQPAAVSYCNVLIHSLFPYHLQLAAVSYYFITTVCLLRNDRIYWFNTEINKMSRKMEY